MERTRGGRVGQLEAGNGQGDAVVGQGEAEKGVAGV